MGRNSKWLLVWLSLVVGNAFAATPVRVAIGHQCARPLVLSISIKNESAANVEIWEGEVPWSDGAKTLRIDAFAIGNGRAQKIPGQAAVADHLGVVNLSPNRVLNGEVALPRILAGFESVHKSSDVIVFFSVRSGKNGKSAVFYGDSGALVIPKSGFFTDECPTLIRNKN